MSVNRNVTVPDGSSGIGERELDCLAQRQRASFGAAGLELGLSTNLVEAWGEDVAPFLLPCSDPSARFLRLDRPPKAPRARPRATLGGDPRVEREPIHPPHAVLERLREPERVVRERVCFVGITVLERDLREVQ